MRASRARLIYHDGASAEIDDRLVDNVHRLALHHFPQELRAADETVGLLGVDHLRPLDLGLGCGPDGGPGIPRVSEAELHLSDVNDVAVREDLFRGTLPV